MKSKLLILAVVFSVSNYSIAQMSPSDTKEPITLNQTKGSNTGTTIQDWKPMRTSVPKGGNGPYKNITGSGIITSSSPVKSVTFGDMLKNPIKMGSIEVIRYTFSSNGYQLDKNLAYFGGGWRLPTWAEMEIIASNTTLHPDLHHGFPYRTLQYCQVNNPNIKYYQRCCFTTVGFTMYDEGNSIALEADIDNHWYQDYMLTILVRNAR